VEELQRQRHATLTQVLAMGVGAYRSLLSGLSEGVTGVADVLEAAHLRGDGGGGGEANAAVEGVEEALWGANACHEEHALEQRRTALLTSTHVLRHGRWVLLLYCWCSPAPSSKAKPCMRPAELREVLNELRVSSTADAHKGLAR
jgi:hypothetical protein